MYESLNIGIALSIQQIVELVWIQHLLYFTYSQLYEWKVYEILYNRIKIWKERKKKRKKENYCSQKWGGGEPSD